MTEPGRLEPALQYVSHALQQHTTSWWDVECTVLQAHGGSIRKDDVLKFLDENGQPAQFKVWGAKPHGLTGMTLTVYQQDAALAKLHAKAQLTL